MLKIYQFKSYSSWFKTVKLINPRSSLGASGSISQPTTHKTDDTSSSVHSDWLEGSLTTAHHVRDRGKSTSSKLSD